MSKTIRNIITGKTIEKPNPINEEVSFDGGIMITETDEAGIITYANRKFREITGYTREELIGSPHNINRHPDMPKAIFADIWKDIKAGKYWEGHVKNMTKEGKYYLVVVSIKPKLDNNGTIVGYIAARKAPDPNAMNEALEHYEKMIAKES